MWFYAVVSHSCPCVSVFVRGLEVDQCVDGVLAIGWRRCRKTVEVCLIDVEEERRGYVPLMRKPVRDPADRSRARSGRAGVRLEMIVANESLPTDSRARCDPQRIAARIHWRLRRRRLVS